ncbi:MAG: radical SAM protein [Eubacterium sp.]|nr:radical SAM protein [Candidatus Colimonas fimequi]
MIRYSVIPDKNPREILLLRGTGCAYKLCTFCDYHEDSSQDLASNFQVNKEAISKVTGKFGILEVINSGSFNELDEDTMNLLVETCARLHIHTIHFECHWLYRRFIPALRARFAAVNTRVVMKQGIETFDYEYRRDVMKKGINEPDPAKLAEGFEECCLLFGLPGQTYESMINDVETGLKYFNRVCINTMTANNAPLQPDPEVVRICKEEVIPRYLDNDRVDTLLENTDFGIGGEE